VWRKTGIALRAVTAASQETDILLSKCAATETFCVNESIHDVFDAGTTQSNATKRDETQCNKMQCNEMQSNAKQ
jgi:hypothetical protein